MNTDRGRARLRRMLERGETTEAICEVFGYATETAWRVALHRANLGIETVARKRRLVERETAEAAQ